MQLGNRRRTLVARFSAAASVLLCLASLGMRTISGLAAGAAASNRLAWAAALFGVPLLLGYARQVLASRRVSWQVLVSVALSAASALGYPLVAAVVVAATLTTRTLRPSRVAGKACEPGCTQSCCQPATVGMTGMIPGAR